MSAPYWSLSQAITWIITHDEAAVAEAPRALVHLDLLEVTGLWLGGDIRAARRDLWQRLEAGKLHATGRDGSNMRCAIPPEKWQDLEATLRTGLDNDDEVLAPRVHRLILAGGAGYLEVTVPADAVRREWPVVAAPAAPHLNLQQQIAAIIRERWPDGKPVGMKAKDFENAIIDLVKTRTGTKVVQRTVARARKLAYS